MARKKQNDFDFVISAVLCCIAGAFFQLGFIILLFRLNVGLIPSFMYSSSCTALFGFTSILAFAVIPKYNIKKRKNID